jgi:signal peptidase I
MANESSRSEQSERGGTEGSVKETIESILVAFILAFIFRAFVVEAFVIPTGSMGPTLMGAHVRIECPDCGYRFTSNYSSPTGDDTDIPSVSTFARGTTYVCPNCGFNIPFSGPREIYFGDRILVLKYRYLVNPPTPWDVVVFKSPYEKKSDPDDPKYTDNFIKRLVGLPGQSVLVLDGDVYIGSHGAAPKDFKILRKPLYAQTALWRDVFDNDYLPRGDRREDGAGPFQEPWTVEGGTGWQGPALASGGQGAGQNVPASSRVFKFENAQGESAIRFDSTVNHPNVDTLSDWLAYDQSGDNVAVGDLKLSFVYERKSGTGPLRVQLTKRSDCFTAEFLPGKVVLARNKFLNGETFGLGATVWAKPLEAAVPDLEDGKPVAIEFMNVDYRVSVRVKGHEVLTTTDAEYTPNPGALYNDAVSARERAQRQVEIPRPVVRIVGSAQNCILAHVRLAKDVYYLNDGKHLDANGAFTQQPWYATPGNIMELGPDEYFVLGDNSKVSLDARFWGAPVDLPREGDYHVGAGRVPGRFLLGKAFFVYWPAGYRPPSLQFGIEPDFGDMRFIR